jgi:hypothetical protein
MAPGRRRILNIGVGANGKHRFPLTAKGPEPQRERRTFEDGLHLGSARRAAMMLLPIALAACAWLPVRVEKMRRN